MLWHVAWFKSLVNSRESKMQTCFRMNCWQRLFAMFALISWRMCINSKRTEAEIYSSKQLLPTSSSDEYRHFWSTCKDHIGSWIRLSSPDQLPLTSSAVELTSQTAGQDCETLCKWVLQYCSKLVLLFYLLRRIAWWYPPYKKIIWKIHVPWR